MRLMRFNYSIAHVADLITADSLSRAPIVEYRQPQDVSFEQDCQAYVNAVLKTLPITAPTRTEAGPGGRRHLPTHPDLLPARMARQGETEAGREGVPASRCGAHCATRLAAEGESPRHSAGNATIDTEEDPRRTTRYH